MENKLMIFENHNVEVFELNGIVYFNPYHVGECLEMTESTVRNHLAKMNENQAKLIKNSNVLNMDFRKLHNTGEKFLTESGTYKLIFKSEKKEAEKFQDWVADRVLPEIRKTGSYSQIKQIPSLNTMNVVKFIADDLKVNEASRITMYAKACKNEGINGSFLPDYVDGRIVKSAKTLLEQFNIKISVVTLNRILVQKGYLVEKERVSRNKGIKKFKSITDKGLEYGENHKSPNNILQTQPLWYEEKFQKLIDLVIN